MSHRPTLFFFAEIVAYFVVIWTSHITSVCLSFFYAPFCDIGQNFSYSYPTQLAMDAVYAPCISKSMCSVFFYPPYWHSIKRHPVRDGQYRGKITSEVYFVFMAIRKQCMIAFTMFLATSGSCINPQKQTLIISRTCVFALHVSRDSRAVKYTIN